MKKFLLKISVFLVVLFAIDRAVGCAMDAILAHEQGGEMAKLEYVADVCEAPVLVFGSSRANHHYAPQILADTLGMACYNCGRDGMGVVYHYGMYRMLRDRYVPRLIVYDLNPDFDWEADDLHRYLSCLRADYKRPGVDSIFWHIDATERWQMMSEMRRYNSKLLTILKNFVTPADYQNGFDPLHSCITGDPQPRRSDAEPCADSTKLFYLERLIQECQARGTQIVFVLSPNYFPPTGSEGVRALVALGEKHGVPCLSYGEDAEFHGNKAWFNDPSHLNQQGAERFSQKVAHDLKALLSEK